MFLHSYKKVNSLANLMYICTVLLKLFKINMKCKKWTIFKYHTVGAMQSEEPNWLAMQNWQHERSFTREIKPFCDYICLAWPINVTVKNVHGII